MTWTTLVYAFVGGILPSLVWLYFLLKEDSRCPEPRSMIVLSFVSGMIVVALALPLEHYVKAYASNWPTIFVGWAVIEEVLKYAIAATFILWRPAVDEPTDYIIYMMTVALGFAAAENALYLAGYLIDGQFMTTFVVGDIRFIGSTLLHVVASAAVGFAIALSKMSHSHIRIAATTSGLILAISLHTAFNTLIMSKGTSTTFGAIFLVWSVAVVFLAAFEVLKYFEYRNLPPNTCTT